MRRALAAAALLLAVAAARADVQSIQVTLGAAATPLVTPGQALACRWVLFQNNAAHNMRIGDRSITSTKGILLLTGTPGGSFFIPPQAAPTLPTNTNLAAWYVAGTQGDVIDVTCESGL